MLVTPETLPEFVAKSDALGSPGHPECEAFWRDCSYEPAVRVDTSLDPFSDAYVAEQLALYGEMSGRPFDQDANEFTHFDLDRHVAAVNPYDHGSPAGLALHVERLTRAFRFAAPPLGGYLLDMGSGWGLSSEIGAYLGLRVTAVDVNPSFVELVNRRAARTGSNIRAMHSQFDHFVPAEPIDMVLFYECLHHALKPWELIATLAGGLAPDGKIVLAGEPINALWWKDWGLRLDPLSVYCIHKWGWFESGWSQSFIEAAFARSGLRVRTVEPQDGEVGSILIAERIRLGELGPGDVVAGWAAEGWIVDQDYGVFFGDGSLTIRFPEKSDTATLHLVNFRAQPVDMQVRNGDETVLQQALPTGESRIVLKRGASDRFEFRSDTWIPAEEIGNQDRRTIGFHLRKAILT